MFLKTSLAYKRYPVPIQTATNKSQSQSQSQSQSYSMKMKSKFVACLLIFFFFLAQALSDSAPESLSASRKASFEPSRGLLMRRQGIHANGTVGFGIKNSMKVQRARGGGTNIHNPNSKKNSASSPDHKLFCVSISAMLFWVCSEFLLPVFFL